MRVPTQTLANNVLPELTDADRARIDARNARLSATADHAHAGLVVEEDYRKLGQLYEQLNSQASLRGDAFPDLDTWMRQRAQERIAQGYLTTHPVAPLAARFDLAMSEAIGQTEAAQAPLGSSAPPGGEPVGPGVAAVAPPSRPMAVDQVLNQLEFSQRGGSGDPRLDE